MKHFPTVLALFTYIFLALSVTPTAFASPAPAEAPQDIPTILQKAIDSRDATIAEAHLDFDRITADFFDTALPQLNMAISSGKLRLKQPLPLLLDSLNSDNMASQQATRVLLATEIRKFALFGVASGCFAGQPLPAEKLAGLDGGLFTSFGGIPATRKEFTPGKQVNNPASQAGQANRATIKTALRDQGSKRSYELVLTLERRDECWVVVGIDNISELTARLLQEVR